MAIDPRVDIGHVHLKVSQLDRAIAFYRDVLGFELMHRYGDQAAFLAAGGYHHHIGLNTWESLGGSPPPRGTGTWTPPPPAEQPRKSRAEAKAESGARRSGASRASPGTKAAQAATRI